MDYLYTNIVISICVLLTTTLLKHIPSRINLGLLLLALATWLIPWHHIELVRSEPEHFAFFNFIEASSTESSTQLSTLSKETQPHYGGKIITAPNYLSINNSIVLNALIISSILIGLLLLAKDILTYRRYIQRITQNSYDAEQLLFNIPKEPTNTRYQKPIRIRVTRDNQPGMATGLFKSTIWVNQRFLNSTQLDSILLHELTHIRQYDIEIKWFSAIVRRLFWWNPIVQYMAKKVDALIELSCDERCLQQHGENYSLAMAEIMLQQTDYEQQASTYYVPTMSSSKNINLIRLSAMNVRKALSKRHYCVIAASITLSSVVCAGINTSIFPKVAPITQEELQTRVSRYKDRPSTRPIYIEAGKKYTQEEAEQYNNQLTQLLNAAKYANSTNYAELQTAYNSVTEWKNTRETLKNKRLEFMIQNHIFSLQLYTLQHQNKDDDIITFIKKDLIDDNYSLRKSATYRNRQYILHVLLHAYYLSGDLLKAKAIIPHIDQKESATTAHTIARLHLKTGDFDQGLAIIDELLSASKKPSNAMTSQLLVTKYKLLRAKGEEQAADALAPALMAVVRISPSTTNNSDPTSKPKPDPVAVIRKVASLPEKRPYLIPSLVKHLPEIASAT